MNWLDRRVSSLTWCRWLVPGVVVVFAALFSYFAGRRGFFPFDQSIIFHGGYRVASGDVLFRDFVTPAGPLVFWLQGLAFNAAGVSYSTYLGTAALMNAVATGAAYLVVRRVFPGKRIWALGAAVVTAVWFYPQFGTPWFENTGYLFTLLALVAALPRGTESLGGSRMVGPFLSGALGSAAFLCKQNVGVLAIPLPFLVVGCLWSHSRKNLAREGLAVLSGVVTVGLAVTSWLYFGKAEPGLFVKYFWEIPSAVGTTRFSGLDTIAQGLGLLIPQTDRLHDSLLFLLLVGAVVLLWHGLLYRRDIRGRRLMIAGAATLALLMLQNSVFLVTRNQIANGLGFLGVLLGLVGAGLSTLGDDRGRLAPLIAIRGPRRHRRYRRLFAGTAAIAVWLVVSIIGSKWALERNAHDIFAESEFTSRCVVPILEEVKWAEPTAYGGQELRCRELEAVVDHLKSGTGGVLFMGDFTILPVLAGRDPTSFLTWYHKGLTHRNGYDEELDRRLLRTARSSSTRTVVIEQQRFFDDARGQTIGGWRMTRAYLRETFDRDTTIGNFRFYERR